MNLRVSKNSGLRERKREREPSGREGPIYARKIGSILFFQGESMVPNINVGSTLGASLSILSFFREMINWIFFSKESCPRQALNFIHGLIYINVENRPDDKNNDALD